MVLKQMIVSPQKRLDLNSDEPYSLDWADSVLEAKEPRPPQAVAIRWQWAVEIPDRTADIPPSFHGHHLLPATRIDNEDTEIRLPCAAFRSLLLMIVAKSVPQDHFLIHKHRFAVTFEGRIFSGKVIVVFSLF